MPDQMDSASDDRTKNTFEGVTVSKVLAETGTKNLTRLFVLGRDKDGKLFAAGTSPTDEHEADLREFLERLESGTLDEVLSDGD